MSMVYLLSDSISLSTLILTKAKNITLMIGGEFIIIVELILSFGYIAMSIIAILCIFIVSLLKRNIKLFGAGVAGAILLLFIYIIASFFR